MEKTFFQIEASLFFRICDSLRLTHIYALKDSVPGSEMLPDDFKPYKWTNEEEFAEETYRTYRELLASQSSPPEGQPESASGIRPAEQISASGGDSVTLIERATELASVCSMRQLTASEAEETVNVLLELASVLELRESDRQSRDARIATVLCDDCASRAALVSVREGEK